MKLKNKEIIESITRCAQSYATPSNQTITVKPNITVLLKGDPDPQKFKILRVWENYQTKMLLAKISYPNCANYEGKKLLLFKNLTESELRNMKIIDPHFCKDNRVIARFKPNKTGRLMALTLLGRKF